ncbi:cysteine proteinase [Ganoderma leucocontextum]|nr:cysteine proteinase [Ganoderma leucocontextum]
MIKHKSKQTPQEIYWERKRREEDEKDASLPPGLINHGNTCFMNSTLQGLIATRPLHDLVYFRHVSPAIQPARGPSILSRRAPQLTNGHGLGGPDELQWTEGMPLGDIFTTIMHKAWDIQDAKRRETISPKEILTTIGRKYDQYLDFRQQDAHEFLRHMLDAMRMEELDIIKKRQPPPPKTKRKRARRDGDAVPTPPPLPPPALPLSPSVPNTPPQQPDSGRPLPPLPTTEGEDGEKLEPFVDMLFGGQLASILVCERCKKVSLTYEDFNDLSLSIKPEDYVNKDRKRDRIRKIARKLRIRPPSAYANNSWGAGGNEKGSLGRSDKGGRSASAKGLRASSVPTSPVRRGSEGTPIEEEPPTSVNPRRRSFDHPGEEGEKRDLARDTVGVGTAPGSLGSAIAEGDDEAIVKDDGKETQAAQEVKSVAEAEGAEQANAFGVEVEVNGAAGEEKKTGKEKDDPWGKLARRISVSMKLSKDREKDKDKDSRPSSRASDRGRKSDIKDVFRVKPKEPRSPRPSSLAPGVSVHEPVPEVVDVSEAAKRAASPTPAIPQISSPLRASSTRRTSGNPFSRHNHERPTKSPGSSAAPKMSKADMAYLRRILADVHPVTGSPLSILQNAFSGNGPVNAAHVGTTAALATQTFWAKLGHLPSVEECLHMFTSVEILDGENMVGCHRCWKIANGVYQPRIREDVDFEEDSDTESEDSDESSDDSSGKSDRSVAKPPRTVSLKGGQPMSGGEDNAALSSPHLSTGRVSPTSTSVVSTAATQATTPSRQEDTSSVSSAPTGITVPPSEPSGSMSLTRKDSLLRPQPSTYGGLPIPQISTTEPDTPESAAQSRDVLSQTWSSTRAMMGVSLSDDSLLTPRTRRRGRKSLRRDGADNSGSSSDDDFDDSTSDTSAPTSPTSLSDGSASPSPSLSPRSSVEKLSDTQLPSPSFVPQAAAPPRARRDGAAVEAVIHLKRFQQTNKHAVSLYGGFKKLDEFVAFPEYLDLAPFLAPRREDFVVEKAEKGKYKAQDKCMYRLYAVVVHIGNMLGGHYVAYTALPHGTPAPASTASAPSPEFDKPVPPTPDPRMRIGPSRKWAYISDSTVKLTTLEEVLKAKAYICMYERV